MNLIRIKARDKRQIRVDPRLHQRIKILAAEHRTEIGLLAEQLILLGIERLEDESTGHDQKSLW
jgi:predicted HicB family RNase H-like nuclease